MLVFAAGKALAGLLVWPWLAWPRLAWGREEGAAFHSLRSLGQGARSETTIPIYIAWVANGLLRIFRKHNLVEQSLDAVVAWVHLVLLHQVHN